MKTILTQYTDLLQDAQVITFTVAIHRNEMVNAGPLWRGRFSRLDHASFDALPAAQQLSILADLVRDIAGDDTANPEEFQPVRPRRAMNTD